MKGHHVEALLKLSHRLGKPTKRLKKPLAFGARGHRFESCLPDATKSQSPANIFTAS